MTDLNPLWLNCKEVLRYVCVWGSFKRKRKQNSFLPWILVFGNYGLPAWTELGTPWGCLLFSLHSCYQGSGGVLKVGWKGGPRPFYLTSWGPFRSLFYKWRNWGWCEHILRTQWEQVVLRHALRSAHLARALTPGGECQVVGSVQAPLSGWESKFLRKSWRTLMKILIKLRSFGPSRAPPVSTVSSPRTFTSGLLAVQWV